LLALSICVQKNCWSIWYGQNHWDNKDKCLFHPLAIRRANILLFQLLLVVPFWVCPLKKQAPKSESLPTDPLDKD